MCCELHIKGDYRRVTVTVTAYVQLTTRHSGTRFEFWCKASLNDAEM